MATKEEAFVGVPKKDRIQGYWYIHQTDKTARIWAGGKYKCLHDKYKADCMICNPKEHKKKEVVTNTKEEALSGIPKKDRIDGNWYINNKDKTPRLWAGKQFRCVHNKNSSVCKICTVATPMEYVTNTKDEALADIPKKDRIDGNWYINSRDKTSRLWKTGRFMCIHEKNLLKCTVCYVKKQRNEQLEKEIKEKDVHFKGLGNTKEDALIGIHKSKRIKGKWYICRVTNSPKCWTGSEFMGRKYTKRHCKHHIPEYYCTLCGPIKYPHRWCASCKLNGVQQGNDGYYPYCASCYYHLHPEIIPTRNVTTKERLMVSYLRECFPDVTMTHNRSIQDGCSSNRPDLNIDLGSHILMVECDENEHDGYICENKRTMTLFQDNGNRNLVVIRFNPDRYKDEAGFRHSSCFYFDEKHKLQVHEDGEWNNRLETLKETIEFHLNNEPKKELTQVNLFYTDMKFKKRKRREAEHERDSDENNEDDCEIEHDIEANDDGKYSDDDDKECYQNEMNIERYKPKEEDEEEYSKSTSKNEIDTTKKKEKSF